MGETEANPNLRLRIRRNASGIISEFRENWREKPWFRRAWLCAGRRC